MINEFDDNAPNSDSQTPITRDELIGLVIRRERMWLDASVAIANTMPKAWEVIEGFLAEENMVNLFLTELTFDPVTEVLEYHIIEEGKTLVVVLPIPLSFAINPDSGLDVYLRALPSESRPSGYSDEFELDGDETDDFIRARTISTNEQRVRISLEHTQQQHPSMFMDVDRLTDLELESRNGTFVKYPLITTLQ